MPTEESVTKEEISSKEIYQNFEPIQAVLSWVVRGHLVQRQIVWKFHFAYLQSWLWEKGDTLFRVISNNFSSVLFASSLKLR